MGPLGVSEGVDKKTLNFNLEAVARLVPYIKLVERERLRVPVRTEAEYDKYLAGGDFDRLFNETIADKLAISRILLLLREKPLSTGEIAQLLNLNPSEVSKHISSSSRHGFVRYDVERNCYALA